MSGWIKLHRSIVEWEWYKNPCTRDVFIHLLLTANNEVKNWQGIKISAGQTVIGRKALAKTLGISEQNVRTAISNLQLTSEITIKSTNRFTLVTIVKWAEYQGNVTNKITNKRTDNQPTINQQLTTPKEVKNIRSKEERRDIYTEIITHYNSTFEKQTKSYASWKPNCDFWLGSYTLEDIKTAITNWKIHGWWATDPSLDLLFRTKNKNGQPVDYIDQLLNLKGAIRDSQPVDSLTALMRRVHGQS